MNRITEPQLASSVLMIRPARFETNPYTAASNRFQGFNDAPPAVQQEQAALEFAGLAQALEHAGVNVITINDTPEPHTPDAVFPNNWVSFHADGTVVLYPMEAPNRRTERRRDVLEKLESSHGFSISRVIDLSQHELEGHYLEGTGSLVVDRANHVAYACLSSRTHRVPLEDFAVQLGYEVVAFEAADRQGAAIYHTNVMMMVGEDIAVVCADSISDTGPRTAVLDRLAETGHEVVTIMFEQMESFAGNMLELRAASGDHIIAMSEQARKALTPEQIDALSARAKIVSAPIGNIESSAGGSVRCMLAEIHLPRR